MEPFDEEVIGVSLVCRLEDWVEVAINATEGI